MDYITAGRRIRLLRMELRLTQEQLAEQTGISASFLGHIERDTRVMSLETLLALCRALRTTPDDLLAADVAQSTATLPLCVSIQPSVLLSGLLELLKTAQIRE